MLVINRNLIAQGPLDVATGNGNDAVMIDQASYAAGTPSVMQGLVKLRTRRGKDSVLIGSNGSPANGSQFRNRTRIRGGRGQDLIDAALDSTPNSRGNQFPPGTQIYGIEIRS